MPTVRLDRGGRVEGTAKDAAGTPLEAVTIAAQGRTEEAESSFRQALEIIEPTMYAILTREIRRSLELLDAERRVLP